MNRLAHSPWSVDWSTYHPVHPHFATCSSTSAGPRKIVCIVGLACKIPLGRHVGRACHSMSLFRLQGGVRPVAQFPEALRDALLCSRIFRGTTYNIFGRSVGDGCDDVSTTVGSENCARSESRTAR